MMAVKLVCIHMIPKCTVYMYNYNNFLPHIALVSADPMCFQLLKEVSPQCPVTIQQVLWVVHGYVAYLVIDTYICLIPVQDSCGDCILENSVLRAKVTKGGLIKSLVHKPSSK